MDLCCDPSLQSATSQPVEAEFRDSRYGVVADCAAQGGISMRGILFDGVTGGSTIDVGTTTFLYRAYADPHQYLDAGAGVRAWALAVTCR